MIKSNKAPELKDISSEQYAKDDELEPEHIKTYVRILEMKSDKVMRS